MSMESATMKRLTITGQALAHATRPKHAVLPTPAMGRRPLGAPSDKAARTLPRPTPEAKST